MPISSDDSLSTDFLSMSLYCRMQRGFSVKNSMFCRTCCLKNLPKRLFTPLFPFLQSCLSCTLCYIKCLIPAHVWRCLLLWWWESVYFVWSTLSFTSWIVPRDPSSKKILFLILMTSWIKTLRIPLLSLSLLPGSFFLHHKVCCGFQCETSCLVSRLLLWSPTFFTNINTGRE